MAPNRSTRTIVTIVTLLSVLGLLYFGVTGLVDPASLEVGGDADAASSFASYLSARNLVLAATAVVLLLRRAWRGLSLVLLINGAVQAFDTALGLARQDVLQTVAPAVIAAALFVAAALLHRSEERQPEVTTVG